MAAVDDRDGRVTRIVDLSVVGGSADVVDLVPGQAHYLVFWDAGWPVGDLWCEEDADCRAATEQFLTSYVAPPPRRPQPVEAMSVSVVICTRDRPEELARCLASFASQSRRPDEIIVVDNAPRDDRTRAVAQAAGVTYVREDRPGLDFARNTGAAAARGDIVAYTDDDTELHTAWIERLVLAFDRPEIMAVTGLVLPATLETPAQHRFEREWGFGRGFRRIEFDQEFYRRTRKYGCPVWDIGAGANMAFRREVFDLVGHFDERLDVGAAGCSGDSEFWYRILAAGYACRYEPGAVVRHHHRREDAALRQQIYAYMRGHVASLLVQFERTGDRGNLRRTLLTLPAHFLGSAVKQLRAGNWPDELLGAQVRGSVAGLLYYFRNPLPSANSD